MTFISATELFSQLHACAVIDASFVLHSAETDGDYRRESGLPLYLAAHIPSSIYVDVSTQFSDTDSALHFAHPAPQAIASELARLGITANTPVVIYDQTGGLFAARLWYLLRWIGINAQVLNGGFAAWVAAGLPISSGVDAGPSPVPEWQASEAREPWVTGQQLRERTGGQLVCALGAATFSGTEPTRYSRRGHIPGSINVPARSLFNDLGFVKSLDDVRTVYAAAGIDGSEEVLLYCGGGISATVNALTLEAIGINNVRIYDGSLEEWSADPSLPLVTA